MNSTARAISGSVLLHGALLVLLVLRGTYEASEPSRLTIINAELLLDGMRSAAAGPARARDAAEEPEPPQRGEPASAEAPAEPARVPVEQATPPSAEPAAVPAAADARAAPEPAEPTPPEPAPAVAATEPSPAAETPSPDTSTPEPAGVPPATTAQSAATSEPSAVPAGTPIPERQRTMLSKRFSAWTGTLDAHQPEHTIEWKDAGQQYTAVLRRLPADGAMGMEHLVVEISTEQNGNKMSTELRMARLAFSSFAQFVDRWDPQVQIHDDTIDGRFHSNSVINVLSEAGTTPVFTGKVTLASHEINTGDSRGFNRRRMFPGGLDMNVRRIMLPARLQPFSGEVAVEDAQLVRFERDARITFYPDGTFGWQYLESAEPEQRQPIDARSHYLVGADKAVLHIRGTVDGRVLVYTPERIVIEGDLQYADDPRDDGESDDYVGLVAERVVEVAPPEITGSGDLEVDASIYARQRFVVRDYLSRRSGTLVIYGSLAAGSVTATEPRYATRIEYDERLESARAPGFPLSDRYELDTWDGEWRAEPVSFEDDGGG